jgi:hypothetical protein
MIEHGDHNNKLTCLIGRYIFIKMRLKIKGGVLIATGLSVCPYLYSGNGPGEIGEVL